MLGISKRLLPWICNEVNRALEGRYIIVNDSLEQKSMTLIGIYAPNIEHMEFWEHIKNKLSKYINTGNIILGVFNVVINKELCHSRSTMTPGIPKVFLELMNDYDLIDVMSEINLHKRD